MYNFTMKKFLIFIIFNTFIYLYACSGDCLSCHPKLKDNILQDTRHKPMLGCISCHKDNSRMSECGEDCFSCHDIKKIVSSGVSEHNVIRECRDCHMKVDEVIILPPQQSSVPTLIDLLKN